MRKTLARSPKPSKPSKPVSTRERKNPVDRSSMPERVGGDYFFICYDFVDPLPPRGRGSRPRFFTVDQYEKVQPMDRDTMPEKVHVYEVTTSMGYGCLASAPTEIPTLPYHREDTCAEKWAKMRDVLQEGREVISGARGPLLTAANETWSRRGELRLSDAGLAWLGRVNALLDAHASQEKEK